MARYLSVSSGIKSPLVIKTSRRISVNPCTYFDNLDDRITPSVEKKIISKKAPIETNHGTEKGKPNEQKPVRQILYFASNQVDSYALIVKNCSGCNRNAPATQ